VSTNQDAVEDLEPIAAHADAVRGGNAAHKKGKTNPDPTPPLDPGAPPPDIPK
jgi:hypothetical protein